jgi:hypothetical protein
MAWLYEISEEITNLEHLISDILDSEDLSDLEKEIRTNHLFQEWISKGEDFEDKAIKVASWIKHQETLAEARRIEYRRIRALADQAQNQAEKLRDYLTKEMLRIGKTKIEGTTAKISIRQKPSRVCLNCEIEALPSAFKKIEITPQLAEIKKAIKADPTIDWAFLSNNNEFSLTIR